MSKKIYKYKEYLYETYYLPIEFREDGFYLGHVGIEEIDTNNGPLTYPELIAALIDETRPNNHGTELNLV
ncbi:MAG: hypothetical protein ABIH25_00150 [Candidatus Woesearchaeota archaeon]